MTTARIALHLLLLLPVAAGCSESKEQRIAQQRVELGEELVTTVEGVSDKASAEAAAAKLQDIVARMKALAQQAKDVAQSELQQAEAQYGPRIAELKQRAQAALAKLMQNPNVMQVLKPLREAAQALQQDLQGAPK